MSWSLHWSEVAVLDANATAFGISEWELMQSAGGQLAEQVIAMLSDEEGNKKHRVLILCGPGNNGGDGFVAAATLATLSDIELSILATHEEQKTEISRRARSLVAATDIPIHLWATENTFNWPAPDLVVDALLGVGPEGAGDTLRGTISAVADWLNSQIQTSQKNPLVLACDVPTGLCTPQCIHANHTISFHSSKIGMHNADGSIVECIGELSIVPLPWPDEVQNPGIGDMLRFPALDSKSAKGERGRLLIVGGGPYHGAPLLAAMSALRVGCDLVHVAMPQAAASRAEWPIDVISEQIPDEAIFSRMSLAVIQDRFDEGRGVQAVLVGPGLGKSDTTIDAVRGLLDLCIQRDIPVVVDADALRALPLAAWPRNLRGIATPHSAEMSRWLSETQPALVVDRAAVESGWFQETTDAENICIIKTGYVDELYSPFGRNCNISGGHPRMSVGGTGDILAGIAAGLLASGMSPWPASRIAVWLLRRAGESAGEEFGPGMVAKDVPDYVARCISKSICTP